MSKDLTIPETVTYQVPKVSPEGNTILVDATEADLNEEETLPLSGDMSKTVVALFTTPRLIWADMMFCARSAFYSLGVDIKWAQGVFWSQVMTRLLQEAVDDGYKYAITLDYDSVFSTDDVRILYGIMEAKPEIDALCPLQLRRGDGSPLATIMDSDGNNALIVNRKMFELTTVPISTGHFGLTIIRLSALKDMVKPWFQAVPNTQGEWGDGKIDDDIMFWKRMNEAGKKVHLTPAVHIGHMELVVTWADKRMNPVYQPIGEWQIEGKPDWAFGQKLTIISPAPDVSDIEDKLERI